MTKYSRILSVYDQLSAGYGAAADCKKIVGKTAVMVREKREGASQYVAAMQKSFTANSKEWAVLGCVLNILEKDAVMPAGLYN